jgi:prepilin peptidase dependent protein B
MLRPVRRRASGFSLVELMISIAVGLVVLAGITAMFAHNVKAGGDTLKMARLHQELQAVMSLMTRDLRRAGYWGNASSSIGPGTSNTNPFTLDNPAKFGSEPDGSCITFSYDRNGDGAVTTSSSSDADERFGFRLRSGAVETRISGKACGETGWEDINDTTTTEITGLNFALASRSADIDGAGPGTSRIVVREVTVTLTGRLRNDTQVSRTLQEAVRVHNDYYQP